MEIKEKRAGIVGSTVAGAGLAWLMTLLPLSLPEAEVSLHTKMLWVCWAFLLAAGPITVYTAMVLRQAAKSDSCSVKWIQPPGPFAEGRLHLEFRAPIDMAQAEHGMVTLAHATKYRSHKGGRALIWNYATDALAPMNEVEPLSRGRSRVRSEITVAGADPDELRGGEWYLQLELVGEGANRSAVFELPHHWVPLDASTSEPAVSGEGPPAFIRNRVELTPMKDHGVEIKVRSPRKSSSKWFTRYYALMILALAVQVRFFLRLEGAGTEEWDFQARVYGGFLGLVGLGLLLYEFWSALRWKVIRVSPEGISTNAGLFGSRTVPHSDIEHISTRMTGLADFFRFDVLAHERESGKKRVLVRQVSTRREAGALVRLIQDALSGGRSGKKPAETVH